MKFSEALKRSFTALSRAGLHSCADENLHRGIVLTNLLSLVFAATIAFFSLVFFAMGLNYIAGYSVLFSLALLPWIYCNSRGRLLAAKAGIVVVANVGGLVLCLMLGPEVELYSGFLCLVGVPVLLFDGKSKSDLFVTAVCFCLSVFCFFFAKTVPLDIVPSEQLTPFQNQYMWMATTPAFFAVIFLELYYMRWVNTLLNIEKDKAQAALVASSKFAALGVMAGGVAHEINTPLGVIRARASHIRGILDKSPVDATVAIRFSDIIVSMVDRIAHIVLALRIFSRDGSNDPFEESDVGKVIQATLELCRERMRQAGVELLVELPADPVPIRCRPAQMSQVLVDLISNAGDAIQGFERKWIRISVASRDRAVRICVTDCGPGIAVGLREKIFNPFFTTKDVGKGTGLGLSLARILVEDNKGVLELDASAANTCFFIQLPIDAGSESERESDAAA